MNTRDEGADDAERAAGPSRGEQGTTASSCESRRACGGRRRLVNLCVAAYWTAMFTGTHIPNPEAIIGPDVSDKLLHFVAYFVLMTLLVSRVRLLHQHWPAARQLASLLLLTAGYAAADELLQAVPGINRHADVLDALADLAGAATAAGFALLVAAVASRRATRTLHTQS